MAVFRRTVALLPLPRCLQAADHGSMATPRLLVAAPTGLAERSLRPWHRGLLKLRRFGLDRRISDGASTDGDLLIAARARDLISPRRRSDLAYWWQHVTIEAGLPPRGGRAIRVSGPAVRMAQQEIDVLVQTLRSGRPVSARGVASARLLLTNGCGPLFGVRTRPSTWRSVKSSQL
jgi:hypothetical protein